jgi:hypothetical protein
MPQAVQTRRTALRVITGALAIAVTPMRALAAPIAIRVVKDPNCGCCAAWIEILEANGFASNVELLDYDALQTHKAASGISTTMASCHTAHVEGYVVEGHVPPADIQRLLAERPDAIGLSVPGMPYGSPGMGPETEREAYAVYLIRRNGTAEVFASYPAT